MNQQVMMVVHPRDEDSYEVQCVNEAAARRAAREESQWESCQRVEIPALGIVIEGSFNYFN
jgi:hypothetical protein